MKCASLHDLKQLHFVMKHVGSISQNIFQICSIYGSGVFILWFYCQKGKRFSCLQGMQIYS